MRDPTDRAALAALLGEDVGLLRPLVDHEAAWFASLASEVPLLEHLRGRRCLDGGALKTAALDAACGVSSAVSRIQAQMTVGRSDPRLGERREIERVAQLSRLPPLGVDPEAWRMLRATQDQSLPPEDRDAAVAWIDAFCVEQPDAFSRLNEAAASHDHAVEGLVARALSNEDALVFPAAARTLWERRFGSPSPLPKLPGHVAVFALSRAFAPLPTGAILSSLGLSATSARSDLGEQETRTRLRKEVDRSLRFWSEHADALGVSPSFWSEHADPPRISASQAAADFMAEVGSLAFAEVEAVRDLPGRASVRRGDAGAPGG